MTVKTRKRSSVHRARISRKGMVVLPPHLSTTFRLGQTVYWTAKAGEARASVKPSGFNGVKYSISRVRRAVLVRRSPRLEQMLLNRRS